ncbi:MAG: phage/plasmid replication protein, II/X family [Chloroflexota bacterium]|nr:phage/plasmid replication protein, II/X family [Chloroflexota bacterium]
MLDTVKIQSPHVSERVARAVESLLQQRVCFDVPSDDGERPVRYEFTSGPLQGSWDTRIRVNVERQKWVIPANDAGELARFQGASLITRPVQVKCAPYLQVEGSIHKALLGHNVYGGPSDLLAPVRWLVDFIADHAGVALADGGQWKARRIDWAHVYDLGSFEAVQEFVSYFDHAEFPRRQVGRYGHESLMVAGDTTTVKLYHKGPEFQAHDRARVARFDDATGLHLRANMLLRCEVEVRAPVLDDTGHFPSPAVADLNVGEIERIHSRDMGRLLRQGAAEMRTVRTAKAVKQRLQSQYTPAMARALYGTWLELSAMGEDTVKAGLSRPTFYRHRKQLVDAGCSWHDSNVKLDDRVRLVPAGFVPLPHDERLADREADRVTELLAPYRRSA